ncbi:type II CAAX prenyl endopeptidase Rce1 family protein [Bacteroidota bacterium]
MFLAKKYSVTEYIKYSGMLSSFRDNLLVKEAVIVLSYFSIYILYSFLIPEADYLHWFTLVLLPFGMLYLIQRKNLISPSFRLSLAFFGLRKNNLSKGILTAAIVGLLISIIQLITAGDLGIFWQLIDSGEILYLFPVTFILIVITVGFTEEFFFRGVLQTRISRLVNSNLLGIIVTSIMFGIYSIPYYYLAAANSNFTIWDPSILFVFGGGFLTGLLLGYVYLKSNENLLSCVILHSTIQVLPMIMVIKSSWF